jgi:hypothetical protein
MRSGLSFSLGSAVLLGAALGGVACGGTQFSSATGSDAEGSEPLDATTSPTSDAFAAEASHPTDEGGLAINDALAAVPDASVIVPSDSGPSADSPYKTLVLSDGPIAYWRMGISSGSMVRDESGHQNDLLLQGTGHVLRTAGAIHGDPDTAIRFDGVASYAIASSPRKFDFPGSAPFTIECWARREHIGDANADYFQHLMGNLVGSPPNRNGYILYVLPSAPYTSFEYDVPAAEQYGLQGPLSAVSTYAHYVAVFDGTAASLYVDGTMASSKMVTGTIAARTSEFSVGRESASGKYYFSGAIDEIAVYDKALTAAKIIKHRDVALGR